MNKKDFIEYVAINSDIPKASAIAIVDIFTNSLQEVIATGESITSNSKYSWKADHTVR